MLRTLFLSLALAVIGQGVVFSAPNHPAEAAKRIDAILQADWKKHNLKGNPESTDDVFVRRIYLDIIGRIPTTRETEEFLNSKDSAKRAKLIDKLLASDGYVQHFYNYWADVLRVQSNGNFGVTGAAFIKFIKDSLRKNKPYDQFVREMIAATGKAWENGAIGYYMRDRGMPLDNFANTSRVFLGTRIECAQCHNHPFDKWTQMQFHQMAAFTYGVETNNYEGGFMTGLRDYQRRKDEELRAKFKQPEPPKPRKEMTQADWDKLKADGRKVEEERRKAQDALRNEFRFANSAMNDVRDSVRYSAVGYSDQRSLRLPHDYQYTDAKPKAEVMPVTMMGHAAERKEGETHLDAYARWMASPDNPRFTSVIVNRLWKKAFGLALIEPLDELMDSTVPMNAELQKHLEQLMKDSRYDMKSYLRAVFNTKAYQAAATKDEIPAGVVYHFTGPVLRRMTAEQMWDSIVALINPDPDMPNLPVREEAERRVLRVKKVSDALDLLSPEEMVAGAQKAGEKYRAMNDETRELTRQLALAREAKDKEKAQALSKKNNELQRQGRMATAQNIFMPAMIRLAEKVEGKQAAAAEGKDDNLVAAADSSMMMSQMMAGGYDSYQRIKIKGYDKGERTKEEEKALRDQQAESFMEEARFFGVPEKEHKNFVNARFNQVRTWLRAAEIDSPAPRGHYLREFGQSDRETIENANHEASVPQALSLMNSLLLPSILDRYSQLMLTVNKAPYPDEKVDAACMALFSRKATAAEKAAWLKAQDKGLTALEDLIYALVNTQQFIFIQ